MNQDGKKYIYHTISYYDRVKGYFVIPNALIETSILFRQNNHGKIIVQHEEFRYDWWWKKSGNKYFFFGDGVMDFFADHLIEPGHKLRFEINSNVMYAMSVHIVGFDERYASEQQRYLDIGRLVEESKSVNKSIFSLMCETLAIHPSGLHWSILQDKVSEKRKTTKNTISNLLSTNTCFEKVEGKAGYWRLNISKLSRKYMNEENQEMMEPADSIQDLLNEETEHNSGLEDGHKTEDEPKESIESEINETNDRSEQFIKLQQMNARELMDTIEKSLIEVCYHEKNKFKKQISKIVSENFIKGNIVAINELREMVESHIKFFDHVFNVVTRLDSKNSESTSITDTIIIDDDASLNANNILNDWNNFIAEYKIQIRYYLELLDQKKSECEDELHQLVSNTSIELTERTNKMISLMKEQEDMKQLFDLLKEIIEINSWNKGDL